MAYQVTKRIKGHDYRYLVESYSDPENKRRKAKWTYVGAVEDGTVRAPASRPRRKHVTKDDIVAAAARLLEFRDPEHITVSVVATEAGVSRSTFYRYFPDERNLFSAALARIGDEVIRALPRLDAVRTIGEAQAVFRRWCQAHYGSIGQQRAIRSALFGGDRGKLGVQLARSLMTEDPFASLEAFLRTLDENGIAPIADPGGMSRAILGTMVAVRFKSVFIDPEHSIPEPTFEELHAMLERAVFGDRAYPRDTALTDASGYLAGAQPAAR
jgi:AcrR family transcriptional regulator